MRGRPLSSEGWAHMIRCGRRDASDPVAGRCEVRRPPAAMAGAKGASGGRFGVEPAHQAAGVLLAGLGIGIALTIRDAVAATR